MSLTQTEIKTIAGIAVKCGSLNAIGQHARMILSIALHLTASEVNELTDREIAEGVNKGKIAAVKMYRNRTKLTLKECKEKVEAKFSELNLEFDKPKY